MIKMARKTVVTVFLTVSLFAGSLFSTSISTSYGNEVTAYDITQNGMTEQALFEKELYGEGPVITFEEFIAVAPSQRVLKIVEGSGKSTFTINDATKKLKQLETKEKKKNQTSEDYSFTINVASKNEKSLVDAIDWAINNKIKLIELNLEQSILSSKITDRLEKAFDSNILIVNTSSVEIPQSLINKVLNTTYQYDYDVSKSDQINKSKGKRKSKEPIINNLIIPNNLTLSDLIAVLIQSNSDINNSEMINTLIASSDPLNMDRSAFGLINLSRATLLIGMINQQGLDLNSSDINQINRESIKKNNKIQDNVNKGKTNVPQINYQFIEENIVRLDVDNVGVEYLQEVFQLFNIESKEWEVVLGSSDENGEHYRTMQLNYHQTYVARLLYYTDKWNISDVRFTPKQYKDFSLVQQYANGVEEVGADSFDDYLQASSSSLRSSTTTRGQYTYEYNSKNQLYRILGTNNNVLASYQYDSNGNLLSITR